MDLSNIRASKVAGLFSVLPEHRTSCLQGHFSFLQTSPSWGQSSPLLREENGGEFKKNCFQHLESSRALHTWKPAAFPKANTWSGLWVRAVLWHTKWLMKNCGSERSDLVAPPSNPQMTLIKAMIWLIYKDVAHKMANITQPQPIWPLLAVL